MIADRYLIWLREETIVGVDTPRRGDATYHGLLAIPNSRYFTIQVRRTQPVRLVVYDVLGRQVCVLHDALMEADRVYPFTFEADALASGWYMIQLDGQTAFATQRVLLVK